jgi:hypothetical protein
MEKIKFVGWVRGMNKIEFIRLLNNNTSITSSWMTAVKNILG